MSWWWRHRRGVFAAGKEIGCGLMTVALITLPLWVVTMAERGPRFAVTMFGLMVLVIVAMVVVGRALRRRRK